MRVRGMACAVQIGRASESHDGYASIKPTPKQSFGIEFAIDKIDGHKFVRQVPIGDYICDFVCREKNLVIEVDGGQHADSAADAVRDRYLVAESYRILRFWNNDVLGNLDGVLITIQTALCG